MGSFSVRFSAFSCALTFLLSTGGLADEWRGFRGPNGSGTSAAKGLPSKWSDTEGIAWKRKMPGPGTSSPIVSGGKIFVTCYSGYGLSQRDPGDIGKLRRHVICLDEKTGKILWDRSLESKAGERSYRGIGVPNHGYASSTPATDGSSVFAYFGRSGLVAYDFDGEELWRADVSGDPRTHSFGSGSSLVLFEDLLIVPASVECEALVAVDKKTGKEVWRAAAEGYGAWWSTPILVDTDKRTELVVQVPDELWSLNPRNGKLRWYTETYSARSVSPSPVHADGVVYAIAGRQGGCIAVKVGGRKDVSKSHVVWKGRSGSYVTSPIIHEGHVYWADDRGIMNCLDAKTGEEKFRERLSDAGSVYSSVLVADGKLYVVSRHNGTFVLEAKPEFKQLAHNEFESDGGDFNACPAVSGGRLILRSDSFVYAIGK